MMLDQEHRDAAPIANGADFVGQPIDLGMVEAAGRLVQAGVSRNLLRARRRVDPPPDSSRKSLLYLKKSVPPMSRPGAGDHPSV